MGLLNIQNKHNEILAKGISNGKTTLFDHLNQTRIVALNIADSLKFDKKIIEYGAILHDIGKANPTFQERLDKDYIFIKNQDPYRHEIASLFFLPLIDKKIWNPIIDMIIAHHKSPENDSREKGIIDLIEKYANEDEIFEIHSKNFNEWSIKAIEILNCFNTKNIKFKNKINIKQAKSSFKYVIKYVKNKKYGYSKYKGVLNAADHFSSALIETSEENIKKCFKTPNLDFFFDKNRQSELYPLSKINVKNKRKHTIVTAPTGSGKTDFLMKRCKNRIFYVLPFQASINAMYNRFKNDAKINDVRLLHAVSKIVLENNKKNESWKEVKEQKSLQNLIGSSVKVLTPYQIASLIFCLKGYEATILDLQGNDVILDEIHVYSDFSREIVLELIRILKNLKCNIHIGTATMPSLLYDMIIKLLGKNNIYEIKLNKIELQSFNRHIIHKINSIDYNEIQKRIEQKQKILIICNTIKNSQNLYQEISKMFPDVKKMLLHSKFKRKDRSSKEENIKNLEKGNDPCILVSTQVIEVSLDISFDCMFTQCAPIDSLIQRFGRINRRRESKKEFKNIFIIKPSDEEKEELPYSFKKVHDTWNIIPEGLLEETKIQKYIDKVFTNPKEFIFDQAKYYSYFKNRKFQLTELLHNPKSIFFEKLNFESGCCITKKDSEEYINSKFLNDKINLEIPINYHSIAHINLLRTECGHWPFIIPDDWYDTELGLIIPKKQK